MRIAINCRSFLLKHYAGIGRYASNLVKSLSELDHENEYLLYVKKGLFDFKRQVPSVNAPNFHVKVDNFNQGLNKTLGKVDIYHSPSPDYLNIESAKIIVTVHDLVYKTFPQGHTSATAIETEKHMQEIVKKASKIICCSKSTLLDLHKYFDIDKNKSCIVYQGVDKNEFFPAKGKELEMAQNVVALKGVDGPFILFVGTIEPRKNIDNIIYAYSLLKSKRKFSGKLVCIGVKGWKSEGTFELIKRLGLSSDVFFLGYVTNRELRYFYSLAEVFVFPSFYEGFGFPILEAFSCGAAVVTSNVSSCPEIAQDAALTVGPQRFEEIAEAIERVITDKNFKHDLQQRAIKRSHDFSFAKTAEETLKVYREVYQLGGVA